MKDYRYERTRKGFFSYVVYAELQVPGSTLQPSTRNIGEALTRRGSRDERRDVRIVPLASCFQTRQRHQVHIVALGNEQACTEEPCTPSCRQYPYLVC